jgi:alpha-N-arabinofuranosidase
MDTQEPRNNKGQEAPLQAILSISTHAVPVTYNPMIFGGFLEHFGKQIYGGVFEPGSPLADQSGFRLDVIEALKELKSPIVRWPGGCYASGYHWQDGVGKNRRPTDDMAWGVLEPNTFGTDEFVELCKRLDWEPYICNNAGNGTIKEMVEWVEYCNGEIGPFAALRKTTQSSEPRNVRIWSIGNENWGQHEIGYKPIEEWAPFVRKAAQAMKAADPDIILTAAALPSSEWLTPLLEQAGEYLDYISIHAYWLPNWNNNSMPAYLECMGHANGPDDVIQKCLHNIDVAGRKGKIKIAFDEWNLRGWHHPGFPGKSVQDYNDANVKRLVAKRDDNLIASQYTMADALFTATFFNACLRHAQDVTMANIAPLVNTRGPLFVHPEGVVKRTHFHTMAMYANLLKERVAEVTISSGKLNVDTESIDVIDGIATVDKSGKNWAIALVNRHPSQVVICTVKLNKHFLEGSYKATVLTGKTPESYNDIENPERVVPEEVTLEFRKGSVSLAPHSLTIVHFYSIPESNRPSDESDRG